MLNFLCDKEIILQSRCYICSDLILLYVPTTRICIFWLEDQRYITCAYNDWDFTVSIIYKSRYPFPMPFIYLFPNMPLYSGGAERLIVDAAVELATRGHKVHVFTSHHDKTRCFEETVSGIRFSLIFSFLSFFLIDPSNKHSEHCVCRYLSSYSLWCLSTTAFFLSSSCSVCISSVYICCTLCIVYASNIWYNTRRSGLCCCSTHEV